MSIGFFIELFVLFNYENRKVREDFFKICLIVWQYDLVLKLFIMIVLEFRNLIKVCEQIENVFFISIIFMVESDFLLLNDEMGNCKVFWSEFIC